MRNGKQNGKHPALAIGKKTDSQIEAMVGEVTWGGGILYLPVTLSHGENYLCRFKKSGYCGYLDSPQHMLFECDKWIEVRNRENMNVISPDTIISYMLKGPQEWMKIENVVAEILRTKELDSKMWLSELT